MTSARSRNGCAGCWPAWSEATLGGGDDVLVVEGDYPATVLPWRRLAAAGVRVRVVRPRHRRLSADDVAGAIGPGTRVLAVTWVDSFTGRALDLDALGAVCRDRGVLLVVNASQALGARPLDVTTTPVDAVAACGYKWLCGPATWSARRTGRAGRPWWCCPGGTGATRTGTGG
jgi:selenocysteine lyase/cysteine desulfurase